MGGTVSWHMDLETNSTLPLMPPLVSVMPLHLILRIRCVYYYQRIRMELHIYIVYNNPFVVVAVVEADP